MCALFNTHTLTHATVNACVLQHSWHAWNLRTLCIQLCQGLRELEQPLHLQIALVQAVLWQTGTGGG